MNNEIGRKLTSLTLMTIMLAGGMTIAAPSMMVPEVAASGALYVSAENATFGNTFGGAQVIEVVVIDPNRSDTSLFQGEPTVKVYENQLRMAQGADGNWYGYFGDKTTIAAADTAGNNLDFGVDANPVNLGLGEANNIYVNASAGTLKNAPSLSNFNGTVPNEVGSIFGVDTNDGCNFAANAGCTSEKVAYSIGQIHILEQPAQDTDSPNGYQQNEWPFIQLYDLTIGTFDVVYEQAGADEVVSLDFNSSDLDNFAGLELDRSSASQESEIHLTITDNQLNIDPTAKDIVIFYVGTSGEEAVSFTDGTTIVKSAFKGYDNYFSDNGKLIINNNTSGTGVILANDITLDDTVADHYMAFYEGAENSGVFFNTDDDSDASLVVGDYAKRGTAATFDYNDSAQSFLVANDFGTIDMVADSVGGEWNSGEALTVTLSDQDLNKNSASNEDILMINTTNTHLVPSLTIGNPLSVDTTDSQIVGVTTFGKIAYYTNTTDDISKPMGLAATPFLFLTGYTGTQINAIDTVNTYFNWNMNSFFNSTDTTATTGAITVCLVEGSGHVIVCGTGKSGVVEIDSDGVTAAGTKNMYVNMTRGTLYGADKDYTNIPLVADVFSFGAGVNNAIYRILLEETDDNTAIFEGTVEYVMLNQININLDATYTDLATVSVDVDIIIEQDMTDEDSPRINYYDKGADGVSTQIADQLEAPTHSGVVSFDADNYKIADTVVVTLDDQDMNTDSSLIDIYTTIAAGDVVGAGATLAAGLVLDITFDDETWQDDVGAGCTAGAITAADGDDGFHATGFTLVETGTETGIFTGSFQVPTKFCKDSTNEAVTVTGTDIEVNYQDFRNASGESIEVGDGASVNANTGSVAFDRTVYPVPYGATTATGFSTHATDGATAALSAGAVTVHVRVTDADYNVSAMGEDTIGNANVTLNIERGSAVKFLATYGNSTSGNSSNDDLTNSGKIYEVSPDSGVFEADISVAFDAGPTTNCPSAFTSGCVLQGDILTVEYTDNYDASGKKQTVTDSATFDLRNGVLQSDKSVYLIGSDMILTLIEPDFDLDNDAAESRTLDLIEWDSDAATTTIEDYSSTFDPEPSNLRETGDSTGIFQVVIEIPASINSEPLDRGEKIDLEYTDWGPAGADYVGQEDEDIGLTVYTSNFGATIELDQKVYTWTDKVYITIVAPDHNMDSGLVDSIGDTSNDPIKVSSRGNDLANYKLVESGADTGIFIGEVTLAGFQHDADGDGTNDITGTASALTSTQSTTAQKGPTEGKLAVSDNDGITVSFEFSEDETVVGSALVRWNIGEVQWLEASYPASGTGVVRIIDADMNLNPEAIDNFSVDAWSDSDAGGIDLTVTETNEATGIFEGTVFFTVSNDSSGHRLRVAEGDTVTAEYEDNTLPDPYTTADELDITATSLIGTVVPPLERAPAANLRTVDAFGNSLNAVSVDQQVQLTADLANGQDREQSFAYLVQIQDGDGVTVSLAWITGSLSSGQSFSPALSWIPIESGSYTATAFVWESVDNPTALSPPVSTTISVQ